MGAFNWFNSRYPYVLLSKLICIATLRAINLDCARSSRCVPHGTTELFSRDSYKEIASQEIGAWHLLTWLQPISFQDCVLPLRLQPRWKANFVGLLSWRLLWWFWWKVICDFVRAQFRARNFYLNPIYFSRILDSRYRLSWYEIIHTHLERSDLSAMTDNHFSKPQAHNY